MDACMLLSELALPIRIWRGPCPPIEVGGQKGEATGEAHFSGVYISATASAQFPPPLLPLSYLLLTEKHQPSFEQGETSNVPNWHVRSGRLRDPCNRIRGCFQLRLWGEEGMLVTEPPLSPSDPLCV